MPFPEDQIENRTSMVFFCLLQPSEHDRLPVSQGFSRRASSSRRLRRRSQDGEGVSDGQSEQSRIEQIVEITRFLWFKGALRE